MTGPQHLQDFEGIWRFIRTISDLRGQQSGSAEGEAVFAAAETGLHYHEHATLTLNRGGCFKAERRYLWVGQNSQIDVFFEDGRDFHSFDLAAGAAEARHWCDPDTYEVRYGFDHWPKWRAIWRVSGPSKDYVMTTTYSRPG